MEQSNRKTPGGANVETLATVRYSRRDLAQVRLLKNAHQERIFPFLRHCPVVLMSNGDVLLCARESCEAIYILLSGRLRMHDPSSTVPDVLVDAGDSIGELVLFQKAVIATTVSAVEPSRVLIVDRKTAWKIIGASHEISRNWLALLAARSRVSGVIGGSEELKTAHGGHPTLDETTGLHSRRWLESMLPRQMTRSSTSSSPLGLLLIEIDGFDDYTKRFGPAAGDHACGAVAQALVNGLRPTDLVASFGTAQFAVVLPDSDGVIACQVGERLRHSVSKATVGLPDESDIPALTVSVGATQFHSAGNLSAFLAAAETALRMAKASGGNRVGIQPIDR